jgi:flagellar hook-length control protein FliK
MPSSLLGGGAAPTGATANGPGTATARSDSATGSDRREFDALLNADTGGKDASAKPASDAPTSTDASGKAPGDAPRRPGSDAPTEGADPAATADAANETPTREQADDADAAPWPPLGLAGLALAGLEPVAVAAAPATNADAAASSDPRLPALPAAATPLPTAPVLPGVAPSTPAATSNAAPIALPLDAAVAVADDTALPKALTDAIASAPPAADAPTTPLLHAMHTVADLKATATTAPFQGDPTATPHVGGDDFDDAMSARIGWLADQKIGHATIKVTPHDLGQIEVRLQMDGDKVHASFSSAHADVRHALESSIPRLREMLNDQGFQLGNADVGHQQSAQDGKAGNGQGTPANSDGDPALTETVVSSAQLMRQRGLVDAYA